MTYSGRAFTFQQVRLSCARSGLWSYMNDSINTLQPECVVIGTAHGLRSVSYPQLNFQLQMAKMANATPTTQR